MGMDVLLYILVMEGQGSTSGDHPDISQRAILVLKDIRIFRYLQSMLRRGRRRH